jgi:hypothetical protein
MDDALRLSDQDRALVDASAPERLAALDADELALLHHRLRRAQSKHRDLYEARTRHRTRETGARAQAAELGADDLARLEAITAALARADDEVSRRRPADAPGPSRAVRRAPSGGGSKVAGPGRRPPAAPNPRSVNQAAVTRAAQRRHQARHDGRSGR